MPKKRRLPAGEDDGAMEIPEGPLRKVENQGDGIEGGVSGLLSGIVPPKPETGSQPPYVPDSTRERRLPAEAAKRYQDPESLMDSEAHDYLKRQVYRELYGTEEPSPHDREILSINERLTHGS